MAAIALTKASVEVVDDLLRGMTAEQREQAQECAEKWDAQSRQIRGWTTPLAVPLRDSAWRFCIKADMNRANWPRDSRPLTALVYQ